MQLISTIESNNVLGECVIWDHLRQCLHWVDIESHVLHLARFDENQIPMRIPNQEIQCFKTPERLCAFGLCQEENWILAAFETGFAFYNFFSGEIKWIARPPELQRGSGLRLNDGRMDRSGRFWCGAMREDDAKNGSYACLYCLDSNLRLTVHERRIGISNGICWSPCGEKFFFADSSKQEMYEYAFDSLEGRISDRKLFSRTDAGIAPDGAVTDTEGSLWSAKWGGSAIVGYSPCGMVNTRISTPASQPTCIGFGGRELDIMFVSSAKQGLSHQQLEAEADAGNLFLYKSSVKGIAEPLFGHSPCLEHF